MTAIPFVKMAGAGNDFVIVDTIRHPLPSLKRRWPAVSRRLCDRRAGIGADGLLVLERSRVAGAMMRVFNPDGSEVEMCGNGARCAAAYLAHDTQQTAHRRHQTGHRQERGVALETRAGVVFATVRGHKVAMRMTQPSGLRLGLALRVEGRAFRLGFVNTGVPHAVIPVTRIDGIDVNRLGRAVRRHPAFAPRGSNVDFLQVDPRRPNRLRIRTYERGVEGETPACGTGVAASAVIYAASHQANGAARGAPGNRPQQRRIEVETQSGDVLTVSLAVAGSGDGLRIGDVVLEGPALRVFDGAAAWQVPQRRPG